MMQNGQKDNLFMISPTEKDPSVNAGRKVEEPSWLFITPFKRLEAFSTLCFLISRHTETFGDSMKKSE